MPVLLQNDAMVTLRTMKADHRIVIKIPGYPSFHGVSQDVLNLVADGHHLVMRGDARHVDVAYVVPYERRKKLSVASETTVGPPNDTTHHRRCQTWGHKRDRQAPQVAIVSDELC